jgi:hypothetical protein
MQLCNVLVLGIQVDFPIENKLLGTLCKRVLHTTQKVVTVIYLRHVMDLLYIMKHNEHSQTTCLNVIKTIRTAIV